MIFVILACVLAVAGAVVMVAWVGDSSLRLVLMMFSAMPALVYFVGRLALLGI